MAGGELALLMRQSIASKKNPKSNRIDAPRLSSPCCGWFLLLIANWPLLSSFFSSFS